ncbi:MAG: DUF5681 domain-containing protein [Candidatus Binataceae bacterium]
MSDNSGYDVGYGKPPAITRFKKGESGNPKGRPKGSRNLATLFEQELGEQIAINEGGRRRKITKQQAMVKQLVNKALSGDRALMQVLLTEIRLKEGRVESSAATTVVDEDDRKVMQQFQERMRRLVNQEEEKHGTK